MGGCVYNCRTISNLLAVRIYDLKLSRCLFTNVSWVGCFFTFLFSSLPLLYYVMMPDLVMVKWFANFFGWLFVGQPEFKCRRSKHREMKCVRFTFSLSISEENFNDIFVRCLSCLMFFCTDWVCLFFQPLFGCWIAGGSFGISFLLAATREAGTTSVADCDARTTFQRRSEPQRAACENTEG